MDREHVHSSRLHGARRKYGSSGRVGLAAVVGQRHGDEKVVAQDLVELGQFVRLVDCIEPRNEIESQARHARFLASAIEVPLKGAERFDPPRRERGLEPLGPADDCASLSPFGRRIRSQSQLGRLQGQNAALGRPRVAEDLCGRQLPRRRIAARREIVAVGVVIIKPSLYPRLHGERRARLDVDVVEVVVRVQFPQRRGTVGRDVVPKKDVDGVLLQPVRKRVGVVPPY
mmetsp:Transcript_3358/g.11986  ORF Transcript_3358/g.11986 Transcript_3358/m.11986 type:complete len:229 (+) Transcript_3358:1593-2279(+)